MVRTRTRSARRGAASRRRGRGRVVRSRRGRRATKCGRGGVPLCDNICNTLNLFSKTSRKCVHNGNEITCKQYRDEEAKQREEAEATRRARQRQKRLEKDEENARSILSSITNNELSPSLAHDSEKFQTLSNYLNEHNEFSTVFKEKLRDATRNVHSSEYKKFDNFLTRIPNSESHLRSEWRARLNTVFSGTILGNGGVDFGNGRTYFYYPHTHPTTARTAAHSRNAPPSASRTIHSASSTAAASSGW